MPDAIPPIAAPYKRRWYQFNLRSLFIFMTVAACAFGWLAVKLNQARERHAAVEAIRKAGDSVSYDYEYNVHGLQVTNPQVPGPQWLRAWTTNDFFASATHIRLIGRTVNNTHEALEQLEALPEVTHLAFNCCTIEEQWLARLRDMQHLQEVDFTMTHGIGQGLKYLRGLNELEVLNLWAAREVTDDAIQHLQGMRQLKKLNLRQTLITDEGLKYLAPLSNLENLDIEDTRVTSAGLNRLAGLNRMVELNLSFCNVGESGLWSLRNMQKLRRLKLCHASLNDADLTQLAELAELQTLDLSLTRVSGIGFSRLSGLLQLMDLDLGGSGVNDAGLEQISRLPHLKSLSLDRTSVSDAGIAHLTNLKQLEVLSLGWTGLTDAALEHLAEMKQLKELNLYDVKMSAATAAKLAAALPQCVISFEFIE